MATQSEMNGPPYVKRFTLENPAKYGLRDEWLAARAPFVGASECAALFGEHPFLTLGDLWAQKVERHDQAENRAMIRGRMLEDAVARWYAAELGVELVEPSVLYVVGVADDALGPVVVTLDTVDDEHPNGIREGGEGVLCATLDREIVGTHSALEVKTSAHYVHEIERYWYWQAQAQMLCADLASVHFAVLDASLDLQSFTVAPNYEDQARLLERAIKFLRYVRRKEMPPDTWLSRAGVERLYPDPKPEAVELDPERAGGMLRKLALARRRAQEYKRDADTLAAMILYELGDFQDGTIDGRLVVTARVTHASDLDTKRLRAEHPELVHEYTIPRTYRSVRLK